jgi:hypothetical protein
VGWLTCALHPSKQQLLRASVMGAILLVSKLDYHIVLRTAQSVHALLHSETYIALLLGALCA